MKGNVIALMQKLGLFNNEVVEQTLEQMMWKAAIVFGLTLVILLFTCAISFRKWKKGKTCSRWQMFSGWFWDSWGANAIRGQAIALICGVFDVCFYHFLGYRADPMMALAMFVAVMMPAYFRPAWTFDVLGEVWCLQVLTFLPSSAIGMLAGASILGKFDPTTVTFIGLLTIINWAYWATGGMSREAIGNQLTAGGGTGKLTWVDAVMNGLLATRHHGLWKSIILMMGQSRYTALLKSEEWREAKEILVRIGSDLCNLIQDTRILESIADPDKIDGLVTRCKERGVTCVELAELQLLYWYLYVAPEDGWVRDAMLAKVEAAIRELKQAMAEQPQLIAAAIATALSKAQ